MVVGGQAAPRAGGGRAGAPLRRQARASCCANVAAARRRRQRTRCSSSATGSAASTCSSSPADRGLCGGFNTNLIRKAEAFLARTPAAQRPPDRRAAARATTTSSSARSNIVEQARQPARRPDRRTGARHRRRALSRDFAERRDGRASTSSTADFRSALSQIADASSSCCRSKRPSGRRQRSGRLPLRAGCRRAARTACCASTSTRLDLPRLPRSDRERARRAHDGDGQRHAQRLGHDRAPHARR